MNKISLILFNFLIGLFLQNINANVSQLTHGLLQQFHNLYGAPPPTIISRPPIEESFLPEIIINRKVKDQQHFQGYNYKPPQALPPEHNYLPPLGDYGPPVQQFPEQPLPLPPSIQEDPLPPLNQGYLPPNGRNSNNNIIITYDNVDNDNGYDYNVPTTSQNPIIFPQPAPGADEPIDFFPEQPSPPQIDQGYNYEQPLNDVQPPTPPQSGYLPPVQSFVRGAKDFDQFNDQHKINNPIRLQMKEMRCLNNQNGFFRAVFRLDNSIGSTFPIVDSEFLIDSRCELRVIQSNVLINIAAEDFQRCGVRTCGINLCLRIRFPMITSMKTGSDSILTLQCKIQERIVAKLHSLKMGISNEIQARSLGAHAHGGSQQPFRTHIELLRKTKNGFTRHVEPKGAVQLGEELLLRAHVNAGDGWNHTKLTDVNLQRMSTSGEILNSANLITSTGCLNPSMRSICSIPPSFEPPLGHRLAFKAVMFQGMQSGDELIMSIKIAGCLDHSDCFVNTNNCKSERFKRSTSSLVNKKDISEISTISFRVEIPENPKTHNNNHEIISQDIETNLIIVGGILLFIFLLIFLFVIFYLQFKLV